MVILGLLPQFIFLIQPLAEFTPTGNWDALEQKIDPKLLAMINEGDLEAQVRIIIQTHVRPTSYYLASLQSMCPSLIVTSIYSLIDAMVAKVSLKDVLTIAGIPWIQFIWLDTKIELPPFPNQTNLPSNFDLSTSSMVGNASGFGGYNGSNVIVAVLDTGIDLFHDDLGGLNLSQDFSTFLEGVNFSQLKILSHVNFAEVNPFPLDFHGHGTFVAGIIAGENGTGIAPGARLLNVKVLSDLGIGYWSWIISGIEWSATHGADVITLAFDTQVWGLPGLPSDPLNTAINAVVELGVIVVTAAGDEGPAYLSIGSPGMALKSITVGAYDNYKNQTWEHSGRGPTLDFTTKPDILAPGINITSTKLTAFDLPINISSIFETSSYGTPISGTDYALANGTATSTAFVAGAIALLLQQNKFLDPESLKIILQQTASTVDTGSDLNAHGAGLINITAAQAYLSANNLESPLNTTRVFTPMLFYDGGITNSNNEANLSLFISSYGSNIMILNQSLLMNYTHLLMGFFGIEYNGTFNWFYEGTILREMHDVVSQLNYSSVLTVLEIGPFLVIIEAEGWNNSRGFRTNLNIINTDEDDSYDVSLICSYSPDLFLNGLNDTIYFNNTLNGWLGNETWSGSSVYWGVNGSLAAQDYESSTNGSVFGHVNLMALQLSNTTVGIEWNLTTSSLLDYGDNANLTSCIGFGVNHSDFINNFDDIWNRLSLTTGNDLAIITVRGFSRISRVGDVYSTSSLIMNIGRNTLQDITTAFFINRTEGTEGEIWITYNDIGSLEPYEFRWINTTYSPTKADIYSAFWIAGTQATIFEIISILPYWEDFLNGSRTILSEAYAFDNIYTKNIIIQNQSKPSFSPLTSVFPSQGGIGPFELSFPYDFSITNCTIISNYQLDNLTYEVISPNQTFIDPMLTLSLNTSDPRYSILSVLVTIPAFIFEGQYSATVVLSEDGVNIGNFTLNFSIRYPKARVLFYRPAPAFSLDNFNDFQAADFSLLLETFEKRLDTIYGTFYEYFNLSRELDVDIDDFSILKLMDPTAELNNTVLSLLDAVIVCDPIANLTDNEIRNLTSFVNNSGKTLFLWVEPDSKGIYSINNLTSQFGLNISQSSSNNSKIFTNFQSHLLTGNLSQIQANTYLYFNVSNSSNALVNSSTGDVFGSVHETNPSHDQAGEDLTNGLILAIGDSDLFKNSYIDLLDNYQFANNSLQWLLDRRIVTNLTIEGERASIIYRLEEFIYLSIHLETTQQDEVITNQTLVGVVFLFPNNIIQYWFAFYALDGWYNTIFLDMWANETGKYAAIFLINTTNALITTHYQSFDIKPSAGELPPPQLPILPESNLLGITIVYLLIISIAMAFILLFLYNRRVMRRRMEAITTEKKKRDLGNLLSSIQAHNEEMHLMLTNPKISPEKKVTIYKVGHKKHKKLIKKTKKLDI